MSAALQVAEAPLRIVQTVSSVEAEAAGISYTVPRLCQSLARQHLDVTLMSLRSGTLGQERPPSGGARVAVDGYQHARFPPDRLWPPVLGRLGRSRGMRQALNVQTADVFHTHGLWMMPNVYPGLVAGRAGKPLVLSPRGMLGHEALQFSSRVKQAFWWFWQRRAVAAVTCFHATAASEYEDIRAFGLRQPVAVVPNGIDLPPLAKRREALPDGAPYVLSLGRIHPKKGLDRLVAAWRDFAPHYPGWQLRLVGPREGGYADELERQIRAGGMADSVFIEPPVYGQAKVDLMRHAELFVLPTLHENFGMTVAESLAVETPVVSTRGAPWQGLEEHRCGWWVEHGSAALAAALHAAAALPATERRAMGARGRVWMARDFGWDGIAERMAATYRWLATGGERPIWVRP